MDSLAGAAISQHCLKRLDTALSKHTHTGDSHIHTHMLAGCFAIVPRPEFKLLLTDVRLLRVRTRMYEYNAVRTVLFAVRYGTRFNNCSFNYI